jgi:WD40 repeat protein
VPDPILPDPPLCDSCGRTIPDDAPGAVCSACLATALLTEGGSRRESRPAPPPASSLDGYELRAKLGEGGFGAVYAAEQLHPVRRRVAIKILKTGSGPDQAQALARFEAERQALALMEHPNIARVFSAGESAKGEPFLVMELVEGGTITDHCRDHGLALPARLALFRDVCDAIAHAHLRGVIHRDIKPTNILVATNHGRVVPKVIDFGIAKATDELLTEHILVTRSHQLLGTPAYMSPEQASGNSIGLDLRSDLYSLGILLYELITGTPPFTVAELNAQPYDEALRTIRTVDPPRPSLRLRQNQRPLPPASRDLDAIVMKAIEKDPERRYESGQALLRDVDAYLAGETVAARPASAAYRVQKFVRRNRGLVAAGAVVALSLVAGTAVSLALFVQARRNAAMAAENEALGKARFSQADFTQATPFMDDVRPGLAVAHLARAVRTDPSNHAAATRLLETLATENWPVPAFPPRALAGMVHSAVYSPDGERLFTTDDDHQLAVWNSTSGELLHRLKLAGPPGSVVFNPARGTFAVAVPSLGKIFSWDLQSYEPAGTIDGPRGRGGNFRFSPDGSLVVAAYDNGHTHLWDLASGKLRLCIPQERDPVRALFSPDGSHLATYTANRIQLWNLKGEPVFEKPLLNGGRVHGILFAPGGKRLLSWSADGTAAVWDLATGSLATDLMRHAGPVNHAALSPDGTRFVTASKDGFVRLWDPRRTTLIGAPRTHDGPVKRVVFSPDGSRFASASNIGRLGDGAVKVWDARTGNLLVAPIYHPRGADQLAFHPDGTQIAIGSRHHEVAVWDLRPRAMRPMELTHDKPVWRAVFHRDDREIVSLALDGDARAWDTATGSRLAPSSPTVSGPVAVRAHAASAGYSLRSGFRQGRFYGQAHWTLPSFDRLVAPSYRAGGVLCAAASESGTLLVTGCEDGRVRLWSLERGEALSPTLDHRAPVTAVALSPGAAHLASGGRDGTISVWELATGRELPTPPGPAHGDAVLALSFSPDGAILASASADHSARLHWGDRSSPPLPHDGDVKQLSFSPHGELLATGSSDNTVRVWDSTTGESVAEPLRHIDSASQPGLFALWSPDSVRLFTTASHDNTARAWDPRSGRMLAMPMLHPTGMLCAALSPSGHALLLGGDHDFQTRLWDPASGEPLSPFFKTDERILSCAFSVRGERHAAGTFAGTVFLGDFPDFSQPLSSEDLALAEALGGFRFNAQGVLEQVTAREWQNARHRLLATPPDSPLSVWMHWLATDPVQRPPSPFQKSPLPGTDQRLDPVLPPRSGQ